MTIQFQRLLDVCRATEELPLGRFWMGAVICRNECGTAGCLIGNYNAMVGRAPGRFGTFEVNLNSDVVLDKLPGDWEHFGITTAEYDWLFNEGPVFNEAKTDRRTYDTSYGWEIYARAGDANLISRERTLTRLRKFIYYKLHKHEMIHDEKYGVREEARTKEGNHYFATRAVQEAASCAAT